MDGFKKYVALSFDDGITQDIRLIKLLDKFGLKCTFNLNSGVLGEKNTLDVKGKAVSHNKVPADEVRQIYEKHEVAGHTLTHPSLLCLDDSEVIRQVEEDRKALERLTGKSVIGFAYPGGGVNFDARTVKLIKSGTSVKYARTIADTYSFGLPRDFLRLRPTCHFLDERAEELFDKFLTERADGLYFLWGHSYELDAHELWDYCERLLGVISNREGVEYLTCGQVYEQASQEKIKE